jgi:hypothetical protein
VDPNVYRFEYRNLVVFVHFGEFLAAILLVIVKAGRLTERWPSARERPVRGQEEEMKGEPPGRIPELRHA